MKEFGAGSFIRYIGSVLESFLKRVKIPLSHHFRRTLTIFDKKFKKFAFKNSPLKFGIMATKGSYP